MVCGIVLGKAKTTKVGMVWYEFNIVNESINESVTKVGIELLGQLKTRYSTKTIICKELCTALYTLEEVMSQLRIKSGR